MTSAWVSASFQSLPLLPTSKLGPSGADSGWVGLCMFWDSVGLSNGLSCEAGSFSCRLNPHRCFQSEVLRLYFSDWNPGLRGLSCSPVVPPGLSACECGTTQSANRCLSQPASCHLAVSPPRLLPVWMNVFSLTPWLSDFHTVGFFLAVLVVFCF